MRRGYKGAGLLLIVVAFFAAALLFLDFKAATSETQTRSLTFRSSSGQLDRNSEVYVYVEGNDDFTREFRSRLVEGLVQQQVRVVEVETLGGKLDHQGLFVAFLDRKILYNPFYPSANVDGLFVYSSTGNTTYLDTFKTGNPTYLVPQLSKPAELVIVGRLSLNDTTNGIVSLKAYERHLAEGVVNMIIREVGLNLPSVITPFSFLSMVAGLMAHASQFEPSWKV